ncbi:MAG: helix-turn-helix domain-containing protein [Lachnospiraceae bacterium]|nr:helix-turn-helix domain-containing protein [Lachnospiraceae bacterium]MDE6185845.1 helix-turn-helix domain-containing protein [Lachnospiraceae bacterium]MDE7286455.1 helix-turn-helix domain-containing protein [Lachnospiraceae bacterium]
MRVCFALTNQSDYEFILSAPIFSAANVYCGKVVYSSEYLLPLLSNDFTDVLIIDAEIPGPDIFEAISKIKFQKSLEVIVIAPSADFQYAYKSMKAHVSELLVRPFTKEQISNALLDASRLLGSSSQSQIPISSKSRNMFAEQLSVILNGIKTIHEINHVFHTTFQEGLFRVATFAVDYSNVSQISEIAEQIWHVILRFLHNNIWFNTYDIVYSIIYNEIRIVFNYPAFADAEVLRQLPNLFLYTQNVCNTSPDLKIFMGVGRAYPDINNLPDSCDESKHSIWIRMSPNFPKNRIVTYTDGALSNDDRTKILTLDKQIKNAINALNKHLFIQYINDFFTLPADTLSSVLAKQTLLNHVKFLRDKYMDRINYFENAYSFYYNTKMTLLTSQTFDEYKMRYIKAFTDMFDHLSAYNSDSVQAKYIIRVKNIIENNYMKALSLEAVAEEMKLSPNYLSRLFHKTTGQTFSDYLLNQRIIAAQTLLSETDYRIKEISSSVGYSDQRYFSRIFFNKIGITPSEYRKLHRNS